MHSMKHAAWYIIGPIFSSFNSNFQIVIDFDWLLYTIDE